MNKSLEDVVLWTGTGIGLNPKASPTSLPASLDAPIILFAFLSHAHCFHDPPRLLFSFSSLSFPSY